jgi:hypothetical protein
LNALEDRPQYGQVFSRGGGATGAPSNFFRQNISVLFLEKNVMLEDMKFGLK